MNFLPTQLADSQTPNHQSPLSEMTKTYIVRDEDSIGGVKSNSTISSNTGRFRSNESALDLRIATRCDNCNSYKVAPQ